MVRDDGEREHASEAITVAGRDRLEDLEPLWAALHEHHAELAPPNARTRTVDESWTRELARYERLFLEQEAFVVIADSPDGPVGYAMVHLGPGLAIWETTDTIATVETLSVRSDARGRGLGSSLLRAVEEELARRGDFEIWLGVLVTNESAVRFYERNGYTRFSVEFRRQGGERPLGGT